MKTVAVNNKNYLINRIYFFTGLVLLTSFPILISMLDFNEKTELFICSWAIVGAQAGMLLILLALSDLFGLLKGVTSNKLKIWELIIPGVAIGILSIVISSLIIEFVYGSYFLEPLIYNNKFMIITLIGPIFLLRPFMQERRELNKINQ